MRKIVAILIAMLMVMSVTVALADSVADKGTQPKVPVILGFKNTPSQADKDMIRGHGGDIKHSYTIINAIAAKLPEQAIDKIKKKTGVAYVEMDAEVHTLEETLPWGVDRIDAELVWNGTEDGCAVTTNINGSGVKVAIIDTGLDKDHPDLAANIAGGRNFVGWFRVNPDAWDDDNGHGSHCGGIVAAIDNKEGAIGVAPEAFLYGVKVLGASGIGWTSDCIAGIQWCAENGMQVASMSWGSSSYSESLENACDAAWDNGNGVLLVAAAGNEGGSPVIYPAAYSSVIAVSATDGDDNLASFSSTGPEVELAAPGVDIYSTYKDGGYATGSGTSMACPHVTGTAALALAADPSLSNVKVRKWLRATAEDLGKPGEDNDYGYGLVDAENATSPGASEMPPILKILSPSDGSTYVTINRSLIWITDEPCAWAAYSLNDGGNVTITGNTTFTAQNGTNNLILYCNDSVGNIGSATTNFTVDETILYRFVQITDSHVDPDGGDYDAKIIHRSVEILEDSLDQIYYEYDPDTIIHTGDITDKGTKKDLQLSEDILNEKAENWSVVAGNHDVLISLNNFLTVFDERNWSFVDENSGSLFIGIDSSEGCGIFNPEGKISEDQIAFLNGTLSRYPNTGKIAFVFMHHTLQNVGGCLITNAEEVNEVLWSHTDNYRKIVQLCGHVHLNNRTDENNVTYLVTSALVSYPMEYRIVDIRANSINMTMGGPAHPEYANLSLGEGANPANNGTDFDRIVDIDITTIQAPPTITSWYPIGMVVNNTEGEPRTFNITVDQVVNVSWQINGTEVQSNGSVIEAYYTNTSAVIGTWNVSAIASNPNGTAMQTWIWNVIAPDTMPPSSIADLNESEVGETWINWTWTDPADADFNHTMVFLNGTWEINTSNPFYNATGLAPDTYYEIGTHTVDKVGNINETRVNDTAKTLISDITPPVISNVIAIDITDSSANITWDTDEAADSLVKYATESGTYTDNVSDFAYVTFHSVDLTKLTPNTTYYYVVNSTDQSGNSNQSSEYSFTTSEAPTMPEMHVGNITMSSKNINRVRRTWYKAIATVLILNSSDKPVDGATVEGHWSGAYSSNTVSGTTSNDGNVTFETKWVKGGGMFNFTVDDVAKNDWTYNSSANEETSGSITVP